MYYIIDDAVRCSIQKNAVFYILDEDRLEIGPKFVKNCLEIGKKYHALLKNANKAVVIGDKIKN